MSRSPPCVSLKWRLFKSETDSGYNTGQDTMDDGNQNQSGGKFPSADFAGFIVSLAHAAMVHMGEMPDPSTGETTRNVDQARYSIDLLDMISEKTRGNLTQEESLILSRVLSDLKMKFVRILAPKEP